MSMDFETVMELDYETQHLGFHPRTFLDRVYNTFYESLFEALNELKKHLCNEYSHVEPVNSIHASTDELFQELIKKLDKAIDKLEVYVNKFIFTIPNHVVLKDDKVHITKAVTKEEDEELDKEMRLIVQKIIEERIRRDILKAKLKEQENLKKELDAFKNKLNKMKFVLSQAQGTQEGMKLSLEKCFEVWNSLKEFPELR